MNRTILFQWGVLAMFLLQTFSAFGQKEKIVEVGGATMYPSKAIVSNAVNSKDNTPLVAAVQAVGVVETLQMEGLFMVFVPTNVTFAKLPAGTVEAMLRPENKGNLTAILTYHVVAGKIGSAEIAEAIKKGESTAVFTTVQGGKLTAWMKGKELCISDENGNQARVTTKDLFQSNGVIHVVDGVVLLKS